jgi:hypothetical protein
MNDFIKRQIEAALAPLESMMQRLLRKAMFGLIALVSLSACIVFLSVAAFLWLAGLVGTIFAALVLAGFYVLIALACILAIRSDGGAEKPRAAISTKAPNDGETIQQAPQAAETKAAEPNSQSENIDRTLAPILAILKEAGWQRANIALLLGAEVAKQVSPFALVITAFVIGFVSGRK